MQMAPPLMIARRALLALALGALTILLATQPRAARADASQDTAEALPLRPPAIDFRAMGGDTSQFWGSISQLQAHNLDAQGIDSLFDSIVNSSREGVAMAELRYELPAFAALRGFFERGFIGVGADELAGGNIRDRIYPELQGYQVYTGHADVGLFTRLERQETGWEYGVSSGLGAGKQTLVQGALADFLSAVPERDSTIFYWTGEAFIGHQTWWSDYLRAHSRLSFRPIVFHSDSTDPSYDLQVPDHRATLRWKAESEWTTTLDTPWSGNTEAGLIFVGGQQPVPVDILPRTWDSIHDLQAGPALGSLVGAGATLKLFSATERYQLRLVGGFFGGYPGAGGELMLDHFVLIGGTWGLEETSSYRAEESRLKYLALGVRYAI